MIKHTQLNLYSFKEAIKNSDSYINIGNTSIQALYFKNKVLDRMYDNYQQAIKYGIEYLKQKPTLQVRDVNIINEILNK
jgi:hypothetical protein